MCIRDRCRGEQSLELRRRSVPVAAHPHHQAGRVQRHGRNGVPPVRPAHLVGHQDAAFRPRLADGRGADDPHVRGQRRQGPQPAADDLHRPSVQDRTGDAGDIARPVPAEGVERGDSEGVGRRGDDCGGADPVGDLLGQRVRSAAVAADQRDDEPTGVVDHHDARVGLLRPQQGCDEDVYKRQVQMATVG